MTHPWSYHFCHSLVIFLLSLLSLHPSPCAVLQVSPLLTLSAFLASAVPTCPRAGMQQEGRRRQRLDRGGRGGSRWLDGEGGDASRLQHSRSRETTPRLPPSPPPSGVGVGHTEHVVVLGPGTLSRYEAWVAACRIQGMGSRKGTRRGGVFINWFQRNIACITDCKDQCARRPKVHSASFGVQGTNQVRNEME